MVCAAQNGLTHLNVYAELWCKLDRQVINVAVEMVNKKKETGTLYPEANITMIPKSEKPTEWNKNSEVLSEVKLERCLKDVFVANINYIKAPAIYFSLEEAYVNIELVNQILFKWVKQNAIDDEYVKTIMVSSV